MDRHARERASVPDRSAGADCDDVMIQRTDTVPRSDSCEGDKDDTSEPTENPTKYIVAETPMLPLQGNDTGEQLPENQTDNSGKTVGKKKTSPFSNVHVKAPLKTLDQNVFDFVDDDPLDKSDLCERVKQRRNKEGTELDNKLKPNIAKSDGKRSRHLERDSAAKNKSLKGATTKNDGNITRLKRPRKGKGHQLLKEAWDADQEGSSQLIDTASTVNLTEKSTVSSEISSPRVNVIETESQESSVVSCTNESMKVASISIEAKEMLLTSAKHATTTCIENSPKGDLAASYPRLSPTVETDALSVSLLDTALPQDNLEVSIVLEHNPETQKSLKHKDIERDRQVDILNGSDVVPPSASSPDVPFYGPINPMESPLYKNYKKPPGLESTSSSTHVDGVILGDSSIEKQVTVTSVGEQLELQVDEDKYPKSHERMSMDLYSETGSTESKETVALPCIKMAAEASHSLTNDIQEEIKVPTDSKPNAVSSIDQHMGKNALENGAGSDGDASCKVKMREIIVLDFNEEKIVSNVPKSDRVLTEKKVIGEESSERRSVEELPTEQDKKGTKGEDPEEGDISLDSTPSLCEELYSQDTYLDSDIHEKSLKGTEDCFDIQSSVGVQSEGIVLEHGCGVTDDPRKASMLSVERSTEDDNTQASVSILAKENEGSVIDDMKTGAVLRNTECNYEKSTDVGMDLPSKVSDLSQTDIGTKVSSACQTEYYDILGIKKQTAVDSVSAMLSVACQTSPLDPGKNNPENESLQRCSRGNDFHMMSKGCQTVGTDLRSIPDEDCSLLARDCNIVNVNAASLCADCKRSACRVPINIFEIVRRNMQEAVARQGLSIVAGSTESPANFTKSDVNTKRDTDMPNVSEISKGHANAGIRVERLSFVPVWMTANPDEGNPRNHESTSPLKSARGIRTSKRNLLRKFINKSKKRHGRRTQVEKEGTSIAESDVDEEENPEKGCFDACEDISIAKADDVSNVKSINCRESRVEKNPHDESLEKNSKNRKELDDQTGALQSNDVRLPTLLSETSNKVTSDVTTAHSKVTRSFPDPRGMIDAPLPIGDRREQSSAAQGNTVDRLDAVPLSSMSTPGTAVDKVETKPPVNGLINDNRNGDCNSVDSKGEVALSSPLPQGKLANKKSKGRPLRLKRKSRRQFVKESANDCLSKKLKLSSDSCGTHEVGGDSQELSKSGTLESPTGLSVLSDEKPTDAEKACTPISSTGVKKSFDKTADSSIVDSLQDIDSQILCDNHSSKTRPRKKKRRRNMIKEEESVSSCKVKADRDVCELSFAVLEHKEDSILPPCEEISIIETPPCEEGQSQIKIDEEVADEGDRKIEDAATGMFEYYWIKKHHTVFAWVYPDNSARFIVFLQPYCI